MHCLLFDRSNKSADRILQKQKESLKKGLHINEQEVAEEQVIGQGVVSFTPLPDF